MPRFLFHSVLIAFSTGIGLRTMVPLGLPYIVFILLVALGIMLIGGRQKRNLFAPFLISTSLILMAVALGVFRTEVASWSVGVSPLQTLLTQSVTLTGVVDREPEARAKSQHLYVKVAEDTVLVTTDQFAEVQYGDAITVTGTLKEPERFTTELGREFNYPGYLLAKGVEYQIPFAQVTVIDSNQANPILASLFSLKHTLMESIEASISEPYAGLGEGLLLGVKQALGDKLENDFRTTGIIHIVVLSGYNIMIVVSFVLFIISFFTRSHWRTFFGIMAIVCFALLVGLSATVVRASIMASLFLIATAYHRTYDISRALLFAGAVMLLINPWLLLYDVGFQLSFMATLGLILIAPRFEGLVVAQPLAVKAKDYVVATVATQIAVLPLLMYHIGEVSLIAVVVNLLVLPVVPVAMLSTFATGLIGILSSTLALPFAWLSTLVLAYVIFVAQLGASVPLASVLVPTFPAIGVAVLYAVMVSIFWYFHNIKQEPKNTLSDWEIIEENTLIKKELT